MSGFPFLFVALLLTACGPKPITSTPSQTSSKHTLSKMDREKAQEGVRLMESGREAESVQVFEELRGKYPHNADVVQELANAYLSVKQPRKAIELLKPWYGTDDFGVNHFLSYGMAFDYTGNSEKALTIFDQGIGKFPSAGRLYTGAGVTSTREKQMSRALNYFETGIKNAPKHATNYYYAALLLGNSPEKGWALIYGEAFMNLEPGTERTKKVSALLFHVINQCVVAGPIKGEVSVSFFKSANRVSTRGPGFAFHYEMTMGIPASLAVSKNGTLSLSDISYVRKEFARVWREQKRHDQFDHPVVRYMLTQEQAGNGEMYSHWLFGMGAQDEMAKWLPKNRAAFNKYLGELLDDEYTVDGKVSRLDY